MDHLDESDTGVFQVTTESSIYLIDTVRGRMIRFPGAGEGARLTVDGVLVIVSDLPEDGKWMPLVVLVKCRVGEPLYAITESPDGDQYWRVSTFVQDIRPTTPPAPRRRSGTTANDPPIGDETAENEIGPDPDE